MSQRITIKAPDLGIDGEVDVIEVLIAKGDDISTEQSLVTLESEKASMEIPSTHAGKVVECLVTVGQKIKSFDPIAVVESADGAEAGAARPDKTSRPAAPAQTDAGVRAPAGAGASSAKATAPAPANPPDGAQSAQDRQDYDFDLLVLGSGPGGYTAAFRAADLGLQVCLVERFADLGGVCLNVGCIPSKALLHTAQVLNEARDAGNMGIHYGEARVDLDRLRKWKAGITGKLNKGLSGMAGKRGVSVVRGQAQFASDHSVRVETADGERNISFANAIIACGSHPIIPEPLRMEHEALLDSTGALKLKEIPEKMLIVGGGIIGLEMATVYRALGSEVVVVEMSKQLIPEADADVVRVLEKRLQSIGIEVRLSTSVESLKAKGRQLQAQLSGAGSGSGIFDSVLVATGRAPNGRNVGAENAGVRVDEHGFIPSDAQMRTNVAHIYSVGDVRSQPMLAHKATHEAKVAAEVIAGEHGHSFDARCIPSVAYTDPELAWVGLTEAQARRQGLNFDKAVFPFGASGRALSIDRPEGMTKLLFSKDSRKRLIGAAIVGPGAGDLIAEASLAIEMGCNAEDIALTIHPHPTLSETTNFAAEIAEGTVTDLYLPRR